VRGAHPRGGRVKDDHRAWWLVIAALVGGIAVIGSSVEIFHGTAKQVDQSRNWAAGSQDTHGSAQPGETKPAQRYLEMHQPRHSINAGWKSHLDQLKYPAPEPETLEGRAQLRIGALAARAGNRAYLGAPPTIPHRIEQRSVSTCLACHGEGLVLDGKVASKVSHPHYRNCTQCHAPRDNPVAPPSLSVVNSFAGMRPAGVGGARAWPGAPPTIPHTMFMRQTCNSCHGPKGKPGVRTTHPERQNCTQCHAPSAQLDQR